MKNKIFILSTIFIIITNIFMIGNVAKAYSNDDFSMELPSEYKSFGTNGWRKSNGDNVNVQVRDHDAKEIKGSLDKALKDLLDETCNSGMYSKIETKEVSKFTKNKYKGIHIVAEAKVSGISAYVEQYAFISDKKIYVITFSSTSKDYFTSDEAESIIDSFTIPNYKEPKSNSILKTTLIGAGIGAIAGAIIAGTRAVKNKSKKE